MSGITSSVGLISGLNTDQIISQLLQIEARPKTLAQQRIVQLQGQQAAFLDINGKLSALKTASTKFRINKVFDSATATSSNKDVLSATATAGAAAGSYSFLVSQVVSTQQVLSRGFSDRDTTAIGLTKLIIEPEGSRLDRDTPLSELNGGNGVARGKFEIIDSSGARAVIDLSRAATINEAIDEINNNTSVRVNISIDGSKLKVDDAAGGGGTLRITDLSGYTTANDLGISGSAVSGSINGRNIHVLADSTALQTLRDGLGVGFNKAAGTGGTPDFTINTSDGSTYSIDIGDMYEMVDNKLTKVKGAVSTVAQLKQRIQEQTEGKVTLSISPDGQGFRLSDASTPNGSSDFEVVAGEKGTAAADLGLVGSSPSNLIGGKRVLADINSTLASNLTGGRGLAGNAFSITTRDGDVHSFTIDTDGSVTDILDRIRTATSGSVRASLSDDGSRIILNDGSGGSGNFIVSGSGAEALGLKTAPAGVASATFGSTRLQRQYIRESTNLSTLNAGQGIGTGTFEIVGPGNEKAIIDIGSDSKTIGDIIDEINSKNIGVKARINDRGDGIALVVDTDTVTTSGTKIKVTDLTGTVGKNLNIVGESKDATLANNAIDGSFERSIELSGTETLDELVTKINAGNARVRASVLRDGSVAAPNRLRLTSTLTGEAGRFVISTEGADLGITTITRGDNARLFFGSSDPAKAIMFTSTTNSFGSIVDGVTINAQSVSEDVVTLSVAKDTSAITTAVNEFVTAFNDTISRINKQTAYNSDTQVGGPLLGDSTTLQLRSALYNGIVRRPFGVSGGYQQLSQVGVKVGKGGVLEVDNTKLQAAIENDPEGVKALFSASSQQVAEERTEVSPGIFVRNTNRVGEYTQQGVAELLASTIDSFISSTGGLLTRANESISGQIELQRKRVSAMDVKIASKQLYLQNQFAALESTLAKLQSQQSALAGLPR